MWTEFLGRRLTKMKQIISGAGILGCFLLAVGITAGGQESAYGGPPRDVHVEPIAKGQRVFTIGNSFHWWTSQVLAGMALDAGIKDHQNMGVSYIGGSRIIQHWDLPDDKQQNPIKSALRQGKVDTVTMSGMYPPDEGIEHFVRLGLKHKPNLRVTLQEYWLPDDAYDPDLMLAKRLAKIDHNAINGVELRRQHAPYFRDMDHLVRDLNQRLGRNVVFVVPTGQAVIRLREKVLAGLVPGVQTQADLFQDDLGHPTEVIQVLAGYLHFAVIYHRSPVGLPVPYLLKGTGNPKYDKEGLALSRWWYARHPDPKTSGTATPDDVKLNLLLQKLAWDTVIHYPLSGLGTDATSPTEKQEAEAANKAWLRSLQVKTESVQKSIVDAVAYNCIVEKTADSEARHGFALRVREDVAKPGWMATGTFSTFECYGKYRVTFRVKCSDNTVKKTVCTIGMTAATPWESVTRELKSTDFAAAGKYEDFSIEILRGDTGNDVCAYIVSYAGHADVSVDTIASERIRDTTDRELLEKLGGNPKHEAKPLGKRAARVLWVQGPFQGANHEMDPFATRLRTLNIPCQIATVDIPTNTTYSFPKDWNELSKYSAILLSDVNPCAWASWLWSFICDWVRQGGTLIVTGGPYAFGKGQIKDTVLEDIHPIQIIPWDLTDGGAFQATGALPTGCPPYRGQAGTYLMHRSTIKPAPGWC